MTVNVYWLSLNPDAIARGYWDHGLLEDLFSGEAWRAPGFPKFDHRVVKSLPGDADPRITVGGVLVVPARHHATRDYVTRLVRIVRGMPWCVLILTGDEEGAFPAEEFLGFNLRMWLMTPQPNREYGDAFLIGTGYPPGIRRALSTMRAGEVAAARNFPWMFSGQVTHPRRQECVDMLHDRPDRDRAWLVETPGFTKGTPQGDYWLDLADTRVALCPSGPISPDSFRTYEALEAGCVPIVDNMAPADSRSQRFWERVFGGVFPFPTVNEEGWAEHTQTIDDLLAEGTPRANVVFAWWQRQKRRMAQRLLADIEATSGQTFTAGPASWITPIVVTSPTVKHPSIDDLDQTIRSLTDRLPGCEIILAFDGVRPEMEHRRAAYEEYTRRALWAANTRWSNVVPLVAPGWLHQANLTLIALDQVTTPLMMFVEHDTPLTGEIEWEPIADVLNSGMLDIVRFHHETAIGQHHAHMMLDDRPRYDFDVPLVRTYQWSQRPHVARVGWYRTMLQTHFAPEARTMIEDVMHGVVASAWQDFGLAGWHRFRIALYAPPENTQRSLHLDSRRAVAGAEATGDPKGTMIFAYPGATPAGAPAPGER